MSVIKNWMLFKSEVVYAVVTVVFFIALLGFVTYLKYEPVNQSSVRVSGTVLSHSEGRTGIGSADPYFIVKLLDGRQVKVKDFGEIPSTYIGQVYLRRGLGRVSNMVTYRIENNKQDTYVKP